jgi:hypothetical protein
MPNEQIRWDVVKGVLGYIYEIDVNPNFTNPMIYQTDTNSVYADTLDFGVKYYWRVAAYHAKDTSGWVGSNRNFTIIDQVLLTSPKDGTYAVPIFPTFSWETITGILYNELQVDVTPDFTGPVTSNIPNTSTSSFQNYVYTGAALDSGFVYYWRVRAVNMNDVSAWSDVWSFTVLTLGIETEQLNGHSISLYPNPCKNHVYINMDGGPASTVQLSIINLVGQTLYIENIDYNSRTLVKDIDVGSFPEGIYLLRLEIGDEVLIKKLIVYR